MSANMSNCTWVELGKCLNGADCPRCKELNDLLREDARKSALQMEAD